VPRLTGRPQQCQGGRTGRVSRKARVPSSSGLARQAGISSGRGGYGPPARTTQNYPRRPDFNTNVFANIGPWCDIRTCHIFNGAGARGLRPG
jgi:hypothetical protein